MTDFAWGVLWGDSWGDSWGPLHSVAESWDTDQGIAPGWLKFVPIRECEATPASVCATAYSNSTIYTDCRALVSGIPNGVSGFSYCGSVEVVAAVHALPRPAFAVARSASVIASAGVSTRTGSNRAKALGVTKVIAEAACEAFPSYVRAFATVGSVDVKANRNPTDEEMLLLLKHHLTYLHAS